LTLNENESADGRNIIKKIGIFAQQMKQEYQEIKCVCTTVVGIVNPYTSVILSPNHTLKNYEGMNIKKEFKKYCSLPLYVINDVKAAATGELYYGSLKDKKNVNAVVLTIGTGFAGCPIINGEIYLGSTFASGEGGQMVINGHYFENHYMVPSLIKRCKAIDNSIINAEQCLELVKTNKDIKTEVDA
jgi:predicted NBD/HSP70 family sugar kinase